MTELQERFNQARKYIEQQLMGVTSREVSLFTLVRQLEWKHDLSEEERHKLMSHFRAAGWEVEFLERPGSDGRLHFTKRGSK